jgi:hypothetical protein
MQPVIVARVEPDFKVGQRTAYRITLSCGCSFWAYGVEPPLTVGAAAVCGAGGDAHAAPAAMIFHHSRVRTLDR